MKMEETISQNEEAQDNSVLAGVDAGLTENEGQAVVDSEALEGEAKTEETKEEAPVSDEAETDGEEAEAETDSDEISFADLGLDDAVLAAIEKKGFVHPSPIQVLAIPRLLNGEANVIARARTGTGKTAAFGLPLVQRLNEDKGHVRAIILEPTRELAMQTQTEMSSFSTGKFPRTCVVYGGASYNDQIRSLRRGVEIVVGTPGRVQDLIDRGALDISKIEYFILDEGDEMLDMGFVDDIEEIFSCANPECRVLLFSATVPAPILRIASQFMGDYEIVEEEGVVEEPLLIEQRYWVIRESEKTEALIRLIDISPDFYGLVFVQRKADADAVSKALDEKGYQVAALHGDIPQGQREKILARFRSKKTRVLVATDVAARGIDINGLTHVVNYDLPFDGPTYVHRIGRTGRAGAAGMAVTFVRPEEQRRKLAYLRNAVKRSAKGEMLEGQVPSVEEVLAVKKDRLFDEVKEKLGLKAGEERLEAAKSAERPEGAFDPAAQLAAMQESLAQGAEEAASVPHLRKGDPVFDQLAEELCRNQNAQEVVASLLAATYGNALSRKRYGRVSSFASGERGGKASRRERGGRGDFGAAAGGRDFAGGGNQMRLFVQMGWQDGYNPRRIADFFSSLLHIPGRQVDAIDMADKFCLLSLPSDAARRAIELSQSDNSLPHIHEDVRASGGRSEGGHRFGGRRFGGERFGGDRFGGERDRYAVGRGDRDRHHERERGGFRSRAKGGSHTRPGVHTATQRSGQAALFKKSYAEEY